MALQQLQEIKFNDVNYQQMLADFILSDDYYNLRGQLDLGFSIEQHLIINGHTLLTTAAADGRYNIVNLLLSRGADIDKRIVGPFGAPGGTALFMAAGRGHADLVQMLLDEGADPQVKTASGKSPADIAKMKGHQDILIILDPSSNSSSQLSLEYSPVAGQ